MITFPRELVSLDRASATRYMKNTNYDDRI